jgi:hypothetical protein
MIPMRKLALSLLGLSLLLAGCNQSEPDKRQAKPKTKVTKSAPLPVFEGDDLGTPMTERVAVIGLLNKRTGEARDLELKPGQELQFGKVRMRLRACERTRPWETFPDEGAFIQLDIRQRPAGTNNAERWEKIFSGWLFKENPAANVVQHPIYDVWVKACKMSFPGEDFPPPSALEDSDNAAPKKPSTAPQSAPAAPKPRPEPEPEPEEADELADEAPIET